MCVVPCKSSNDKFPHECSSKAPQHSFVVKSAQSCFELLFQNKSATLISIRMCLFPNLGGLAELEDFCLGRGTASLQAFLRENNSRYRLDSKGLLYVRSHHRAIFFLNPICSCGLCWLLLFMYVWRLIRDTVSIRFMGIMHCMQDDGKGWAI